MKRFKICAFVSAVTSYFLYASTAIASTPAPSDPKLVVDALIQQFMADKQIPGVAIALYYKGQSYFYNYGVVNENTQQPVDQSTIFEIGSVTKVFTATLVAQEINTGVMSLNDPVVKYLPAAASEDNGPITKVTLQELVTHTSSLPSVPPGLTVTNRANFSKEDLMQYISNWQPAFPIGTTYQYSNIGFGLLGDALEGATHQTYWQLLKTNLLQPLYMTDTSLNHAVDPSRYAQGYNSHGRPAMRWTKDPWPAGGALRSTSTDMLAFLKANLDVSNANTPLSLIKNMQLAQKGLFKAPLFIQSMGWMRLHNSCIPLVGKAGGTSGFSSFIELAPTQKMGIVILANKGGDQIQPGQVAKEIMAQFAGC